MPYNGSLLVFGGSTYLRTESKSAVATNEVLWLDRTTNTKAPPVWVTLFNRTRPHPDAPPCPAPRHRAAAAVLGDTLWVYGGLDNNTVP